MTFNSYINDQLAAAHRRDLLQAAERNRLVAQARERRAQSSRSASAWRRARRHALRAPRLFTSSPSTATR